MADYLLAPTSWTTVLPLNQIFSPGRPLEVDVGCGKGRFLIARATANPDTNYLGIDRQLTRLRRVHRKLERAQLTNTRLLRIEASYAIDFLLPPKSVSAFYVFFPDPWPKKRHHKRRLFSESFMNSLTRTLTDHGQIHIATDHIPYYEAIVELFAKHESFTPIPPFEPTDDERTEFETIFVAQNAPIGRASYEKKA